MLYHLNAFRLCLKKCGWCFLLDVSVLCNLAISCLCSCSVLLSVACANLCAVLLWNPWFNACAGVNSMLWVRWKKRKLLHFFKCTHQCPKKQWALWCETQVLGGIGEMQLQVGGRLTLIFPNNGRFSIQNSSTWYLMPSQMAVTCFILLPRRCGLLPFLIILGEYQIHCCVWVQANWSHL